jgi:hypothetical protein
MRKEDTKSLFKYDPTNQTNKETSSQAKHPTKQPNRQTNKQTNKQINKQTNKQKMMDRQTTNDGHIHRMVDKHTR